jgi:hypothetical protein
LGSITFESFESGTLDNGNIITREFILTEELAHLHLDELKELLVVDLVSLIKENYKSGDSNLTSKEDVLTSLRHWAISCGDYENTAIHLGSSGDHVFHVVSVTWAVNVSIVTIFGLILNVSRGDRDTTLFLLRSGVDFIISLCFTTLSLSEDSSDSSGEGGFTVVNVTDSADVDVRLVPFELFFSHCIG